MKEYIPIYQRKEWVNMHTDIISLIASKINPYLYVELGICNAQTITKVSPFCDRAIGVDIERRSDTDYSTFEFFQMRTDEFFDVAKSQNMFIDMLFIDADHRFEQSLKDFDNFFNLVSDDGLIFLHDTYPKSKYLLDDKFCSDSFKTAWEIRNKRKDNCEIITFPFNPGLSIIRKSRKQLLWL